MTFAAIQANNNPVPVTIAGAAPSTSRKESAGDYGAIVCQLNDQWRVIECRNGIQWILQRRANKAGGDAWYGRSYCCTKKALIRVCRAHSGEINPNAMAVLDALPERIGGAAC